MLEYIDDYDYLMVYQIISEMQSPERVVKSANQNGKKGCILRLGQQNQAHLNKMPNMERSCFFYFISMDCRFIKQNDFDSSLHEMKLA